jgi:hypothetical protein
MDRRLATLVGTALLRRWETGQRQIESEAVYHELVAAGEEIPDGALRQVFAGLFERGVLGGTLWEEGEAAQMHGGASITWLDPAKR